jgi:hypothetical protein
MYDGLAAHSPDAAHVAQSDGAAGGGEGLGID